MGFRVTRYSAIALKVHALESDGLDRGLDVSGGSRATAPSTAWARSPSPSGATGLPARTASPEARHPVPADTLKFLTATYGPSCACPTRPTSSPPRRAPSSCSTAGSAGCAPPRRAARPHKRAAITPRRSRPSPRRSPSATRTSRRTSHRLGRCTHVARFADRGVAAIGLDFSRRLPRGGGAPRRRPARAPPVFQPLRAWATSPRSPPPSSGCPAHAPLLAASTSSSASGAAASGLEHAVGSAHMVLARTTGQPGPAVHKREKAQRPRSPQTPEPGSPTWRSSAGQRSRSREAWFSRGGPRGARLARPRQLAGVPHDCEFHGNA